MHTEGRWTLLNTPSGGRVVVSLLDGRALVLGKVIGSPERRDNGEAEANARLFRAAREMYLELQRLRGWLALRQGYRDESDALASVVRVLKAAENEKPAGTGGRNSTC